MRRIGPDTYVCNLQYDDRGQRQGTPRRRAELMKICAAETGQTLTQVATVVLNSEVRFDGHD